MSPNRIVTGLGTLILGLLTGVMVFGQDREVRGMQWFESGDVRPYDDWAKPKDGFFFTFDGIFWYIGAPHKTTIGDPSETPPQVYYGPFDNQSITETNSLSTGQLRAKWREGNRIEFGYVDDHQGFLCSTIETNYQTEYIAADTPFVVFKDPAQGPLGQQLLQGLVQYTDPATNVPTTALRELPTNFTHLSAENQAKFEGVEAMYLYRPHQLFLGGTVEWLVGARFFEFDDRFLVDATGGTTLDDSQWNTYAKNLIVGPQVGLRWFRPMGRFALSTEGRFLAGVNSEAIHQNGVLGSNLDAATAVANNTVNVPQLMSATYFNSSAHFTEFTPLVEFRVEGHAQLTRLISFKAGWTGMWMDNVARASDMINYAVSNVPGPAMGITTALHGNRQDVFIHGLNIGIELNR